MMEIFGSPMFGEKEEKCKKKFLKIDKEKNLNGDDIKELLIKKIFDPYKYNTERSAGGINMNPFDLIIGNPRDQQMCGLEIKGDTDTFDRLKTQLDAYTFCFNEVYLVLHKKEVPKWLPNFCGVMRIFEDGEVYVERPAWIKDVLDITSQWEWDTVLNMNDLNNLDTKHIQKALKGVAEIRRNVLFNRMFAQSEWGSKDYAEGTWIPLSEYQKKLIIGFNVPYAFKKMKKELRTFERKVELIKATIEMSNPKHKEYKFKDLSAREKSQKKLGEPKK